MVGHHSSGWGSACGHHGGAGGASGRPRGMCASFSAWSVRISRPAEGLERLGRPAPVPGAGRPARGHCPALPVTITSDKHRRAGTRTEEGNGDDRNRDTGRPGHRGLAGLRRGTLARAIDVRDFIQANYTPYDGDAAFLAGADGAHHAPSGRRSARMFPEERARGILDVDAATPSTITSHAPGYIDRDRELIVGLQTDAPLKRAIMPNGGLRMVEDGLDGVRLRAGPARARDLHHATARPTTTVSSTPTPPRSAPPAAPASSPGCPTPTAAAGSSATTAGWRSTASTG